MRGSVTLVICLAPERFERGECSIVDTAVWRSFDYLELRGAGRNATHCNNTVLGVDGIGIPSVHTVVRDLSFTSLVVDEAPVRLDIDRVELGGGRSSLSGAVQQFALSSLGGM